MSRVYTDTLEPRKPTQDITLGATGDTTVISANSINTNTIKDSGGNTLWTSNGSGTLSSLNGAFEGNLKLKNGNIHINIINTLNDENKIGGMLFVPNLPNG